MNGKIIHIAGNHDCFSKETRLLTKNGYKYYHELHKGDLIPTVNLENNCVEFKSIEDIIINKVEKAYTFNTKTAEGVFSSNHKHLYSFGTEQNLPIKTATSETLWNFKSPIKFLSAFQGGFNDFNIQDDWLLLYAWILTDGGLTKKHKYIRIYQSKEDGVNQIKRILDRLDLDYTISKRQRDITAICGKQLINKPKISYTFNLPASTSRYVRYMLNLQDKYKMPDWLWQVSDRQFKLFINEVTKGDGTICSDGTHTIYGTKDVLYQLLGFCVTHNIRSNVVKDNRGSYYLTVSQSTNNREKEFKYKTVYPDKRKIVDYNDIMWCVTVPNHTLFVELNGKTLITRNSNNGVPKIIQGMLIKYHNRDIYMVHKPEHYNDKYKINFCGHVHEKWLVKKKGNTILLNVGVDVNKFMPISMNEAMHKIKQGMKGI